MLTQEEYVQRVLELKRQGWSIIEIADEVGHHPATVSKWLQQGGPPPARRVDPSVRAIDERWAKRVDALIAPPSKLLATSVFEIIKAEGHPGSYPSVGRVIERAIGRVRARWVSRLGATDHRFPAPDWCGGTVLSVGRPSMPAGS